MRQDYVGDLSEEPVNEFDHVVGRATRAKIDQCAILWFAPRVCMRIALEKCLQKKCFTCAWFTDDQNIPAKIVHISQPGGQMLCILNPLMEEEIENLRVRFSVLKVEKEAVGD